MFEYNLIITAKVKANLSPRCGITIEDAVDSFKEAVEQEISDALQGMGVVEHVSIKFKEG